jgi:hypothetical protein
MKKLLFFLTLIAAFTGVESCSECCSKKTITCPPYADVNAQAWMPYKTKTQLVFSTLTGEMDTIKIDAITVSAEHTMQNSCSQNNCDASFIIGTNIYPTPVKTLTFNHYVYGDGSITSNSSMGMKLFNDNISGNGFDAQGIVNPQFNYCRALTNYLPLITLNAKTFTLVQEIVSDTSCKSPTLLRKLYLAKNKGIIGYQTNSDGKLWVLQ